MENKMAISLYDLSVGSYLQALGAVSAFLAKGREHCEKTGIDLDEIVETRLYEDMLPFRFQLISVAHHSLGAIQGVEAGVFSPPPSLDLDYDGLHKHVDAARTELEGYSRESIEALEDNDMIFKLGDMELPFTAQGFLMSFSLPNFYFHVTTAYDILRMRGIPLGKRDVMGRMRLKS
jgi:hypothetical protein